MLARLDIASPSAEVRRLQERRYQREESLTMPGDERAAGLTDSELAEFLGIPAEPWAAKFIAELAPEKRAVYERMHQVEWELKLWQEGVGPKPQGIIVCHEHKRRRP